MYNSSSVLNFLYHSIATTIIYRLCNVYACQMEYSSVTSTASNIIYRAVRLCTYRDWVFFSFLRWMEYSFVLKVTFKTKLKSCNMPTTIITSRKWKKKRNNLVISDYYLRCMGLCWCYPFTVSFVHTYSTEHVTRSYKH